MRLRTLALCLGAFATAATFLFVFDPGVTVAAHALLLWGWTALATRHARRESEHRGPPCLGCGRADVGRLPDGSCERCAHPGPRRVPAWSAKGS